MVIEVATMFPGPGESGSCVCQNLETMLMGFDQCPACEGRLKAGLQPWHLQCGRCSYEGSSLRVYIDVQGDREVLDEVLREEGLSDLRQRNFAVLAEDLAARFAQRAEGARGCWMSAVPMVGFCRPPRANSRSWASSPTPA